MDKSANPVSIFWNRKLTQLSTSRLCLSVLAIALVSLLVATLISHRHWRSSDEGDQLTGVEYTLLFTGAVIIHRSYALGYKSPFRCTATPYPYPHWTLLRLNSRTSGCMSEAFVGHMQLFTDPPHPK